LDADGLKDGKLSPHDLRHTCRAWLDDTGAAPTMQHLLMRHADIRSTWATASAVAWLWIWDKPPRR